MQIGKRILLDISHIQTGKIQNLFTEACQTPEFCFYCLLVPKVKNNNNNLTLPLDLNNHKIYNLVFCS